MIVAPSMLLTLHTFSISTECMIENIKQDSIWCIIYKYTHIHRGNNCWPLYKKLHLCQVNGINTLSYQRYVIMYISIWILLAKV